MTEMKEEELQALYAWIDEIPLSRQKKNITRDFSDGVMAAEVVHHFIPKQVDVHNYSPANATQQKLENWRTLNRKVFSRLNFSIPDDLLQGAASSRPGVVEFILSTLRVKTEKFLENCAKSGEQPSHQVYYDPHQFVPAYNDTGAWNQEASNRHPGPASVSVNNNTPLGMVPGVYPHSNGPPSQAISDYPHSRIPLPQHGGGPPRKEMAHGGVAHSISGSVPNRVQTLPPVNQHGGLVHAGKSRSQSNPEKKSRYAQNIRHPPVVHPRQRQNSAGVSIKLAEKDQRILESQECIQFLQMKVTRLEHLVQIKDMKINELKRQLEMINIGRHNQRPFQRI